MASNEPEASTSSAPPPPEEHLPRDARLMALLLASKGVEDTTPQVLHQLLEFAHRYTTDILLDAVTFNEHAGKTGGKLDLADVELAVQAKVNWEFKEGGERDYLHPIAQKLNSQPLPPVPESAFIRLPHPKHMLTAPNFNLLPNKPPPGYGRQEGESSESGSEDDDDSDDDDADLFSSSQVGTSTFSQPPPLPPPAANGDGVAGEGVQDEDMSEDEDEDDMMAVVDVPSLASAGAQPSGIGEKRPAEDDEDDYDA